MVKKIFVLLFFVFAFLSYSYGQTASAPDAGDGSASSPYQIETLEHLYWISVNPQYWNNSFVQVADIDAAATAQWPNGGWFGIGRGGEWFTGQYDGGGYTISNLYADNPDSNYVALFSMCDRAVLQNINITNATFSGDNCISILAAKVDSTNIDNCFVTGSVSGSYATAGMVSDFGHSTIQNSVAELNTLITSSVHNGGFIGHGYKCRVINCRAKTSFEGESYCGGFIGYISDSYIKGCSSEATIANADYASTFIGYSYTDTILNCHSTGAITNGDTYNGGLAGYINFSIIDSCWTSATIEANSYIGGLAGYCNGCTVTNSYATENVKCQNGSSGGYNGGLIGYAASDTVKNCFATGNVEGGYTYLGGLLGSAFNTNVSNCYATGNVSTTGSSAFNLGGFSGCNSSGVFQNCYSTGIVTSTANFSASIGGFTGVCDSAIFNCYTTSHVFVNSPSSNSVGGFLGSSNANVISNCYSVGEVVGFTTPGSFVGYNSNEANVTNVVWNNQMNQNMEGAGESSSVFEGVAASFSQMKTKATYSDWDFSERWSINETKSYPWLVKIDNAAFAYPDTVPSAFNVETAMEPDLIALVTANDIDPDSNDAPLTARWSLAYRNSSHKALYQVGTIIDNDTIWGATNFVVCNVPIEISSYEELCKIGAEPAYPLNATYSLTKNIDASSSITAHGGQGFLPIGNDSVAFSGIFNGNRHSISNLFINRDTNNCGLFGLCHNAQILDVRLKNSSVRANNNTGVLVGRLLGGNIDRCSIADGLCSGKNSVGGLVGYATGSIRQCSFEGSVSGTQYTGGIVGQVRKLIQDCYAAGTINGDVGVGGITGYHTNGTITSSYSIANVHGNTNIGALVGAGGYADLELSFWDDQLTEIGNCHGWDDQEQNDLAKTTSEMKTVSTFTIAGWDFAGEAVNGTDDIWVLNSDLNNGYPILMWQLQDLSISIAPGYNIVVIDGNVIDTDIKTVFSPVLESIVSIKNLDEFYSPAYPDYLNSLTKVYPGEAYIVQATEPAFLYLPGTLPDMSGTTIDLNRGWNLIGYPLAEPQTVTDVFSEILQKLEAVKSETGFYIPGNQLNSLTKMEPGVGYYVKVSENCSFTW